MAKSIAIMQPYIFPYIGYFQLVNYVDKFVFYDDVTFIKQGWINRNKITQNNQEVFFTIPLSKASSNTLISDVKINLNLFRKFKKKFYKSITQSYSKSPHFDQVFKIITKTLDLDTDSISKMAIHSVKLTADYLEMGTEFKTSKLSYDNTILSGQDRVLDIVNQEDANYYINPIGGRELYSSEDFKQKNIDLSFIKVDDSVNKKLIIDILMNFDKEEVKNILNQYNIIK